MSTFYSKLVKSAAVGTVAGFGGAAWANSVGTRASAEKTEQPEAGVTSETKALLENALSQKNWQDRLASDNSYYEICSRE